MQFSVTMDVDECRIIIGRVGDTWGNGGFSVTRHSGNAGGTCVGMLVG